MDHLLNGMIHELSQSFKFNFVDVCRVVDPVINEFGNGIHCLHLCVMVGVVCMLIQQLSYLEDLSGSKAELTLNFGAIIVGWFSFVAVAYGALVVVLIVVVIVALSISVGLQGGE